MAKVNNKVRGRIRDIKHKMLIKTVNRQKNLDGCNARNAKY